MRWLPSIEGTFQSFSSAPKHSGGSAQSSQVRAMLIVLALTPLADCSAQPTPDQVSPVPTEGIVSRARCELRQGLVETVRDQWFLDEEPPVDPKIIDPETVAEHLNEMKKRYPTIDLTNDWNEYMDIAVSYDWAFDITEINEADGSLGFSFPAGTFDASGKLNLQREGKRTFKTQDTFGNLLTKQWYNFCHDINRSVIAYPNETPEPRGQNIIYPMTGSIGLGEAVKSFLRIAVQGGGLLGTFTDDLAFTTTVDAKAGATVSLAPLADKLRVMSGTANLGGNRVDVHKVKISLTFPRTRLAQLVKKKLVADVLKELDAKAGYKLNSNWRSAYALCVVDGRAREVELKVLRPDPPELACIKSTDAFLPRGKGRPAPR